MNFIIVNWVKYCTKEAVKTAKLVTIGSAIVLTVAGIKYKPAYQVTVAGEKVGYVSSKEMMEAKYEKYMNDTSNNVAYREIKEAPKYELKLINRGKPSEASEVMVAVKDLTTTTYKTFAVTANGEEKAIVKSQDEAEQIINEIKQGVNEEVDLKLGIVEKYNQELKIDSKEKATQNLNEVKSVKIAELENKKAAEAARKAEEERKAKLAEKKKQEERARQMRARSAMATGPIQPGGSANGIAFVRPVNGSISSRFGVRSGSRHGAHTGLDIASSAGTPIRAAAGGTVIQASYAGSYGNLIKVDHGNGVQTYYAHCSSINVGVGQTVATGQVIGAVGSTGNSTGPHLHLEIRINGTPVNPQNYLY